MQVIICRNCLSFSVSPVNPKPGNHKHKSIQELCRKIKDSHVSGGWDVEVHLIQGLSQKSRLVTYWDTSQISEEVNDEERQTLPCQVRFHVSICFHELLDPAGPGVLLTAAQIIKSLFEVQEMPLIAHINLAIYPKNFQNFQGIIFQYQIHQNAAGDAIFCSLISTLPRGTSKNSILHWKTIHKQAVFYATDRTTVDKPGVSEHKSPLERPEPHVTAKHEEWRKNLQQRITNSNIFFTRTHI